MRKIYLYKYLTLTLFSVAFMVILNHGVVKADATFNSIFGEIPDHSQIDALVRKEKEEDGAVPKSSLEDNLLLSEATLARLNKKISQLEKIVKSGGWPAIPPKGIRIKSGDKSSHVAKVKQILVKQGDLSPHRLNIITQFDDSLEDAILHFQKRHGIRTSGYVDRRTRLALAVSAEMRLGQIKLNKSRLQKALKKVKGSKYIVVNVPDFSLQAINDGRIELTSKVVVGREDRQTPDINAVIQGVNFNPYWHVPYSLIKADIIPSQIKDPTFMKENHIKIFTSWGGRSIDPATVNWRSPEARKYKFRQDPGDHNALGLIRIQMPNADNVYLHDTPTKKLYGLRARAYSAGCVRVEKIRELTAWILENKKKWDRSKIDEVIASKKRVNAMIKKNIPVQFVYITAWVDPKGALNFREDIYDRDQGLKKYASRQEKVKGGNRLSP
ncbi:MAG: L,D-transpeptidase family protein [Methyloligellaceae bacterium]